MHSTHPLEARIKGYFTKGKPFYVSSWDKKRITLYYAKWDGVDRLALSKKQGDGVWQDVGFSSHVAEEIATIIHNYLETIKQEKLGNV
jgi:hypothetical protein